MRRIKGPNYVFCNLHVVDQKGITDIFDVVGACASVRATKRCARPMSYSTPRSLVNTRIASNANTVSETGDGPNASVGSKLESAKRVPDVMAEFYTDVSLDANTRKWSWKCALCAVYALFRRPDFVHCGHSRSNFLHTLDAKRWR